MQLSEIRTLVRYRLRESSASIWTDSELNNEINLAQRYIASQVAPKYMPEIVTVDANQTSSSGDSEYDLPTDFLKFAGDVFINGERWVTLEDYKEAFRLYYSMTANDIDYETKVAFVAKNQLILTPAPTTTGNNIFVTYVKIPDELTSDTSIADLNDTLLDMVIDLAAANALKKADMEKGFAMIQFVNNKLKEFAK